MVLLLIGGINWGLVGAFNYNVVTNLLGDGSTMTRAVYGLVGLCALYEAYSTCTRKQLDSQASRRLYSTYYN